MKTSRLLGSLVLACLALIASQAGAVTVHYIDGDLFLGFRSTDGTQDYLVDIGQPAQFVNAPPNTTITITSPSSVDLAAVFGPDWYTRIDPNTGTNAVRWAWVGGRLVTGGGDVANTLYSSNPTNIPWPRRSNSSQSGTTSLTDAQGTNFDGNNSAPNCDTCIIQADGSANSYASFQPGGPNSGGISYQTWNPSNEGTPALTLTLDRIIPSSTGGASQLIGTLALMDNGTVLFTAAPMAQSAFSRKTHGAAGTFDIPLPLTGNVGIECRSGGATNDYQMIINFATTVTVGSASLTSGIGSVSSFSVSGSQVTVNLTGVTNVQRITVTLINVNDGTRTANVPISMGVLIGDTTANGTVNSGDVSQTKSQSGQPVTSSNFREDVNASGTISSTDVAIVKSKVGTALPP